MNGDDGVSAQWMESMVGVCYHAADGGKKLLQRAHDSRMEIRPESQQIIAREIWHLLEMLGLGPRVDTSYEAS